MCIGKERRSAEDKVALAPRTWMEKKSTAGEGMLRSTVISALGVQSHVSMAYPSPSSLLKEQSFEKDP